MSQPWRDVMQANDWRNHWATASNQPRTNSYDLVRSLFFQTITKLNSYHIIEKDNLERFQNREEHLRKISSFVKYKLQPRCVDYLDLYKIAGELLERCLLKKQYLKGVREYYQHEGKVLRDPKNLIELIRAPKINLGRLLPPVQGVRLEVYAPQGINLQFENFEAGHTAGLALSVAFGQWANAFVPKNVLNRNPHVDYKIRPSEEWKSISKKPFFVWLEKHPICTGKGNIITGPGHGAFVRPDLLGCVQQIIQLEERRNHTLHVIGGVLKKLDSNDNYHTIDMAGKGRPATVISEEIKKMMRETAIRLGRPPVQPPDIQPANDLTKTAAFVWTHKEELLVGEHKADENVQDLYTDFFHHTSLDAGNPVLCAGMIRVIDGKVELISNNSGHYQPGEASLKRFVRWLQGQQCLTGNAIVNVAQSATFPTVGDFLGIAMPARSPVNVLMKERNKFLDSLSFEVGTVSLLYDLSQGKAVAFIRIRSPESKIASQYFGGDFKNDIDTAKDHSGNEMAWNIPYRIVLSLAGISKEPLAVITDNVKRLKQDGIQFSTTIYDLKPLKQGSTMSQLLQQKIKTCPPISVQ